MIPKADFAAKEVPTPINHWCKSGHQAPATFRRGGTLAAEEPTKFFSVISRQLPEINGVYCEPCLIIANAMQRGELKIIPK